MIIEVVSILIVLYVLNRYFSGTQFTGKRPDLTGKTAVITGGNTGIGKQTALDLVKQGCFVIIGARDIKKSDQAVAEIKKISGSDKIQHHYLDLSEKKSIEQFVGKIKSDKIDYLINNAGIMSLPTKKLNSLGYEMQYAVNHLGHFYITYLLWNKLQKSQFFRIINVSSLAHKKQGGLLSPPHLNFDDMNFQKTKYSHSKAYTYSKLYNVLFTKALAQRISVDKGASFSLHPGAVRTELTRYILPYPFSHALYVIYPLYYIFFKSAKQGAQTTLHLTYTPIENLKNGEYYADCALSKKNPEVIKQNWDKLWEISQRDLSIVFKI